MVQTLSSSEAQLAAFELRQTPAGLLARYARGRIGYFWARQSLTLIGALSLALMETAVVGLVAAGLALLGEGVDCATLRMVPRWQRQGHSPGRIRAITTLSAGFQALTIAGCIFLTLGNGVVGEADFFAFAFLTGAAMNAGVVLPYHPSAAKARLAIYMATGTGYLGADVALAGRLETWHGYEIMAVLLVAYNVRIFLQMVVGSQRNHVRSRRELLLGARALAQSNQDLHDTQREARQLDLVARHANDSVVMTDKIGRIVWVNEAFEKLTGNNLTEAEGQEIAALLNGPETSRNTVDAIARAVREGHALRSEILNYTKDGRRIWVDTNLVPICDDEGRTEMAIAIERDITSARAHAEELTRATLRAEDGARAKAAFLVTMSHEIRTPMNGIVGMADLLSQTPLGPQQREYVGAINSSGEALLRIINDILDYSKLDAGKMATVEEPFNLGRCIRMSADLLRGTAHEKGLYLDICHDVAMPETVLGDEGRVRQVLLNLLGNAIKFTEVGGVTLRVSVERRGQAHAVCIQVKDTGIGVTAAQEDRIFDQFEQADVATTRKFGGTGLGLTISRQLARRMGGDLVLAPREGPGSVFEFTFCAGVKQDAPQTQPTEGAPALMPDLTGARILVAEDNRTNSLLIARYLSDLDVTLWFAGNGNEALDMVRQHAPDIVLMDVSMPELDGIAATVQIRNRDGPQPHIIALTANVFVSDRSACLAAGMNDFLSKPIGKADLLAALMRGRGAHKSLGTSPPLRVSREDKASEAPNWTSQPASGTTSGRSTRLSGR